MIERVASHAGSWYSNSRNQLNKELERNLERVPATTEKGVSYPNPNVRAIIGPHAGYSYSGPTAAYAYKSIDVSAIERVFILGPSHHVYLDGCALSRCDTYQTPLGDLILDKTVISQLHKTGQFTWMKQSVDEEEHSIEMHLPYIYKIFEGKIDKIKIVPILVGSIKLEKEKHYGQLLGNYLADPRNLFVVSSDFCHWGRRFNYNYCGDHDDNDLPIHEAIRRLDHQGMETISSLDLDAFDDYLMRTRNTICGRHPIAILLAGLQSLPCSDYDKKVEFVKYDQSSACQTLKDSSVSYASAFVSIVNK
ncbi:MEMO1 family, partial [Chlamydoabsidia padenii]